MEEKKDRKLKTASYIIIGLVGVVISSIVAYNDFFPKLTGYFWGISSSATFAFFIYIVLKYFLVNTDDIIIDKIDNNQAKQSESVEMIISKINSLKSSEMATESYCTNEGEALNSFFRNINLEQTESIYMIGYSMAHVFQQHRQDFIKILKHKIKVNVLLVDPHSTAGILMKERVGTTHKVGGPHRRTLRYITEINDLDSNESSNITVSKVSWIPSCTVILAKNSKENFYVLMTGINGFNLDNSKKSIPRRLYSINFYTYKDLKIEFFQSNFEYLWSENSKNIYTDINLYLNDFLNEDE